MPSKFPKTQYYEWMKNLLQNVRLFNLVVYVQDEYNANLIRNLSYNNENVYTIIFPLYEYPLYKNYKEKFIENHARNTELNQRICWELIMLWCSKQFLVYNTETRIRNAKGNDGYPTVKTRYYGYVDIGYFRQNHNTELNAYGMRNFPNAEKLLELDATKIHYGLVNPDAMPTLINYVLNKNEITGLPKIPIPPKQVSISGGFFILSGNTGMSKWWFNTFHNTVIAYLMNDYLIKDDQICIVNDIILNKDYFKMHMEEPGPNIDNWFMFQRILSSL